MLFGTFSNRTRLYPKQKIYKQKSLFGKGIR